ncbi:SusC/RagA family TonB-linked outer membrane protein, partial [Parapedobacter defluvii]|uniref:SusC/RagA family TonB-linked outer membrane protein n=1 Tax=Parapedobacter defluvii TaxID=2045106 RepID=UPI003341ED59
SLLAVATIMCLYAHAQRPDTSGTVPPGEIRDTLTIQEVEINAGYYTTTRKMSTGSIVRISEKEIANTAAFNPLASLTGRVPGLAVTQSNGIAGSSYQVQLRGRNSITQGSEPLYIVNGVPFVTGGELLNTISSAAGSVIGSAAKPATGLSPFNLINAEDIVSIDVLKDADATAIYGSRGANGVILITTRSGVQGKTQVDVGLKRGVGRAPFRFRMLNTQEYVAMRKEAFRNDDVEPAGIAGNPGYAPDIMVWDTTRYTDLQDLLTGGTAHFTNLQLGISGGSPQWRYRLGGAHKRESGVLPGDQHNDLSFISAQLSYSSGDNRFGLDFSSKWSLNTNNVSATDLTSFLLLPPNVPSLYTADGELNWYEDGYGFENPLAYSLRTNRSRTSANFLQLSTRYSIWKTLLFKLNVGYNINAVEEKAISPKASNHPDRNIASSLQLANGSFRNLIAEPQLAFHRVLGPFSIDVMAGGTWQRTERLGQQMLGMGFANDLLLESIGAAGDVRVSNSQSDYRYQAVFGRAAVNYGDKYVVNITGRRDGSSRFGPGEQFANFSAIGAAWIISEEPFLRSSRIVSLAKVRASYGTTGNDQISDYQFLDAWQSTTYPYLQQVGIKPVRLYNPDYAWEVNRKFESAIELGLLRDRIFLSIGYFRNRSDNQLINYRLPTATGFQSILRNFGAVVENRGVEVALHAQPVAGRRFQWDIAFNATFQRNRLLEFPGLETSSYANTLIVGEPLNIRQGYAWLGVDAVSGVHMFDDRDGSGSVSGRADYRIIGHTNPRVFGGMTNTVSFANLRFSFLLDFRQQRGAAYYTEPSLSVPGMEGNQTSFVLGRWRPGATGTGIQRFSAINGSDAYRAFNTLLRNSSATLVDASFIRCRNVNLSYSLPTQLVKRASLGGLSVFLQADNLFTISGYQGGDPETQQLLVLPPLRTVHLGINITI